MVHGQVSRSYRDSDDHWQRSDSLSRDDLLNAAKALNEAHTWITAREQEQRRQARDEDRPQAA